MRAAMTSPSRSRCRAASAFACMAGMSTLLATGAGIGAGGAAGVCGSPRAAARCASSACALSVGCHSAPSSGLRRSGARER